jgi:hypothetical protein
MSLQDCAPQEALNWLSPQKLRRSTTKRCAARRFLLSKPTIPSAKRFGRRCAESFWHRGSERKIQAQRRGEASFLASTFVVIDVTLAALFWSWGPDEDVIARLVKKTLFVGVFAFFIGNWNNLARIVFESFSGLGLKSAGSSLSSADLLRPGRIAQVGIDACRPILESISSLLDYVSFFENFEMPPLFVIGASGDSQLVNYRVRGHHMVVDRLFAAAELRFGSDDQRVVRIVRSDGRPAI